MKHEDDLQELWMSQSATWNNNVPSFGMLDDMTAPVEFPASTSAKIGKA
jgi:hypothetical protein